MGRHANPNFVITPHKRRGPIAAEFQSPGPAAISLPGLFGSKHSNSHHFDLPISIFCCQFEQFFMFSSQLDPLPIIARQYSSRKCAVTTSWKMFYTKVKLKQHHENWLNQPEVGQQPFTHGAQWCQKSVQAHSVISSFQLSARCSRSIETLCRFDLIAKFHYVHSWYLMDITNYFKVPRFLASFFNFLCLYKGTVKPQLTFGFNSAFF